jgi:hypothetical protein
VENLAVEVSWQVRNTTLLLYSLRNLLEAPFRLDSFRPYLYSSCEDYLELYIYLSLDGHLPYYIGSWFLLE